MVDGKKSIKGNKDWTKIGVIVSIFLGFASLYLSFISMEKSSESSQNFNELFANKSEKRNEFLRLIEADIKRVEPKLQVTHNCFDARNGNLAENFSIFVLKGQQNPDSILATLQIPKIIEYVSNKPSSGGINSPQQENMNVLIVGSIWNGVNPGNEVNLTIFYKGNQMNNLNTVKRSFYYSLGTKEDSEDFDCSRSWITNQ